jgi:hypothetical protein
LFHWAARKGRPFSFASQRLFSIWAALIGGQPKSCSVPDNFKWLPDRVVAPLLRALMCVPPQDKRLYLRRAEHPRRPGLDQENDYNILFRGNQVGRIWRYEYPNHPWAGLGPWHWSRCNERGRDVAKGHGSTLAAVMADFRREWDAAQKRGAAVAGAGVSTHER